MVTAGAGGQRASGRHRRGRACAAATRDYVSATALLPPPHARVRALRAAARRGAAARLPRPDVIYATSPPLTMALPGARRGRARRAPLVFEVRDLWPEAPIQMGALRNPPLQRLARALERSSTATPPT